MGMLEQMTDLELAKQFLALCRVEESFEESWKNGMGTSKMLLDAMYKNVPDDVYESVLADLTGECPDITGIMAPVVVNQFSRQELRELVIAHEDLIMQLWYERRPCVLGELTQVWKNAYTERLNDILAPLDPYRIDSNHGDDEVEMS